MQNSTYLESKVLTAPPHRLHLMLIEGAIRFGRQADAELQRGDATAAATPLLRVIDILGEMLAAVREKKTELNQRLADVYLWVFCKVSEAKINSDTAALAEALRILDFERETWQMVCEKFGGATASGPPAPQSHAFNSSAKHAVKTGVSWQA